MIDRLLSQTLRYLQAGAYIVIILWGIRGAAEVLVPVLMGLLLAFCFLPVPNWLMKRFAFGKRSAIALTSTSVGALILATAPVLYWKVTQLGERLPVYQEHFIGLYQNVANFLHARGIDIASADLMRASLSARLPEYAGIAIPQAAVAIGDGLLIAILAAYFLVTLAEQSGPKRGSVAQGVAYYAGDVQRYIAITAQTGAISALANVVLLFLLGVDFPLLWGAFSFFLSFIPSVGFFIAVIPPIFLALVMSGWKTAVLAAIGLVIINLLQEYILTPILMKKAVNISFIEILLSLMFWSFLLGFAGAILAVPLTIALRKFIETLARGARNP